MLLFIFLFLILLGFHFRKSKIFSAILFFFTWILIGWNTNNADFENYKIRFEYTDYDFTKIDFFGEQGFNLLNYFGSSLHLDYLHFKIIISFICLFLIFRVIYIYARYHTLVIASYCLFLFVLDVTQLRNFIAFSIVLSALPLLIKNKFTANIWYVLWVLIACTIHISSIFYLIFVFANVKFNKKLLIIWVLAVFVIKTTIYQYINSMVVKANDYQDKVSFLGFIMYTIIQIINLIYLSKIHTKKISIKLSHEQKQITVSDLVLNINWLLLFLLPFYLDSITFSRLFRNMTLFNFIFITNHFTFSKKINFNMVTYISYGLFFLLVYNVFGGNFEKIVLPVFNNNSFNLIN